MTHNAIGLMLIMVGACIAVVGVAGNAHELIRCDEPVIVAVRRWYRRRWLRRHYGSIARRLDARVAR